MNRHVTSSCALLCVLLMSTAAHAAKLDGSALALKSSGTKSGKFWALATNGFVGTYIQVDQPGDVMVTLEASGAASSKVHVMIGDSGFFVDLTETTGKHTQKSSLPAGVHFIRVEFINHHESKSSVTICSLEVTGAKFLNEHTDTNALAAADSYVANYRRGPAKVKLTGASPGSNVRVKLKRHDFMFGTAVGGFDKNELFIDNPPANSDAAKYQDVIKREFNALVPGNAGKWEYNERERDVNTMGYIDDLIKFAKANDMKMRMHTLLWNTGQQPQFIKDLVDKASKGDASAKSELRKHITERIQYYVRDRAKDYYAIDILNEPYHQPAYFNIFGIDGIAEIHRECAQAVKDAGANAKLFVNEYNIFQYSSAYPFGKDAAPDPYANWYREYVEKLRAAGAPVDGIGVQYYALMRDDEKQPHSASRMFGVIQNLAVAGIPITLTEFGVQTKSNVARAPKSLQETMRLSFGSPHFDGFILWGFWKSELWDQATGAAFFEKDWTPTPVYQAWKDQMAKWTADEDVTVAPDNTIQFTGFFGDYDVTIGEKTMPLTLIKGRNDYTLAVK